MKTFNSVQEAIIHITMKTGLRAIGNEKVDKGYTEIQLKSPTGIVMCTIDLWEYKPGEWRFGAITGPRVNDLIE